MRGFVATEGAQLRVAEKIELAVDLPDRQLVDAIDERGRWLLLAGEMH